MIELLMLLTLSGVNAKALAKAEIQPCVWPNRCARTVIQLAQVQPCVWPNRCAASSEPAL